MQYDQPDYLPKFNQTRGYIPSSFNLIRAFNELCLEPQFLSDQYYQACSRLGVTWSQCQGIKYYLQLYKLCREVKGKLYPTGLGTNLLHEWDGCLENINSLYLLHWKSLQSPCYSASLWCLFFQSNFSEFTKQELILGLQRFVKSEKLNVARSSIICDCDWLINSYSHDYSWTKSPFNRFQGKVSLDVLHTTNKFNQQKTYIWEFLKQGKPDVDEAVILAACLEFAGSRGLISLTNLTYAPGSPGRAFKLLHDLALTEKLERVIKDWQLHSEVQLLVDENNAVSLQVLVEPKKFAFEVLNKYYEHYCHEG